MLDKMKQELRHELFSGLRQLHSDESTSSIATSGWHIFDGALTSEMQAGERRWFDRTSKMVRETMCTLRYICPLMLLLLSSHLLASLFASSCCFPLFLSHRTRFV